MQPEVMFIALPAVNLQGFPATCATVLGYKPLAAAKASPRELSQVETFLSCLAAVSDRDAPAGFAPHVLPHLSVSVFLIAEDQDVRAVPAFCPGMALILADTTACNVTAAVLTGNLAQWREAIAAGMAPNVPTSVRGLFNKLYTLFRRANFEVWRDYCSRRANDDTLLLEHKQR
jgi:hypothetical protein